MAESELINGAPPPKPRSGQRADQRLVELGLAESRTQAQKLIAAGRVLCDGKKVLKPSQDVLTSSEVEVEADEADRYVSRGGFKLAEALAKSGLNPTGWDCLDVGQSTGGFTDCLLQAGAASVLGLDVGHDQLHSKLRDDERVVCLEGINARNITPDDIAEYLPEGGFQLIVADVSFISLTLILPQLPALLAPDGHMLLLIKPQFEVGKENIERGGVVTDPALHQMVKDKLNAAADDAGLQVRGWFDSPILGGGVGQIEGNREFLLWVSHEQTND